MHVVVGLSGGVDSAVAAALYLRKGFAVTGVYLDGGFGVPGDALQVAARLGIPVEIVDISAEMQGLVIRPFLAACAAGLTPNPCVACNPAVKFKALFEAAERLGAGLVATGHYAVCRGGGLYKGVAGRDQSYMLYRLPPKWLPRIEFPLGEMDKPSVRALARELCLPVADKKDSMDVCFPYEAPDRLWTLCGEDGRVLGAKRGLFTVGQRRGLGVPSSEGRLYVTSVDAKLSRVTLGALSRALRREFRLEELHWLVDRPAGPLRCRARIRHTGIETPALVTPGEDGTALMFDEPVFGGAAGQSAVFYGGDRVLGGGILAPS